MAFVDDCLTTGKKVQLLRQERGISQERLAEIVDVHKNTISNIERGLSDPSFQTLLRISEALEVSPLYFAPDHYGFTETQGSFLNGIDDSIARPMLEMLAAIKEKRSN